MNCNFFDPPVLWMLNFYFRQQRCYRDFFIVIFRATKPSYCRLAANIYVNIPVKQCSSEVLLTFNLLLSANTMLALLALVVPDSRPFPCQSCIVCQLTEACTGKKLYMCFLQLVSERLNWPNMRKQTMQRALIFTDQSHVAHVVHALIPG